MPPKTERSISLPTNKPPRIATRSRATAHTHPNPQHTSTPPPLAFIPAAATRWNGDSQPAMPSQSQDSEHQLSHEEPNTPRATVSSPPTTTTTSTSTSTTTPSTTTSSTPSSSSARPVPTRRDTRTNRRASQSSTTNTVSPGPSDPQPSEQPAEERARSTTPVSEVGEVAETHEARIPTRSHSADSSVAEPSEDPSHPGGRRKSTRLTASVADSVEGEAAPDMNVTRRRKGGRGLARANGGSVGRPKAVAEYDESDDSETEVTAPKLTREEKKARREALLQERFAELDTMQRQIEGGTHPSFTQELDDIEAKRKRKLQIAKTRLAYSKVSIDEFLLAAEKQAHDDFAVRFSLIQHFSMIWTLGLTTVNARRRPAQDNVITQ
ncbi:hypothetical protein BC937DRAFT_92807 [Endogone sp. FLAS-F59071]|nr:hypothetical protein BC937DRAFT_92807 [Endogone sp. FLAS-F59071]|eukprot:RUS15166.1 hypothetical protein BC937DRAFT_92807 [Endogone sp. FLAS-F59071]